MTSTPYHLTDSIIFFRRTFPSANMTLILGERPLLIDTGFGSDFPETQQLLEAVNISPADLHLVLNTHYHSDHVGGNHQLQTHYGRPIAAYYAEANLINARDAFACSAAWLQHPIEPYTIDQLLYAGDEISAGSVTLQVLHTPGHTLGHISFYEPQHQILILGDVVHADDVAWLNNFREGVGALERMLETLDYLLTIPAKRAISGHGPIHDNPSDNMRKAIARYQKWQKDPEKIAWHATKRIFTYALMLKNGMTREEVHAYLLHMPWFADYAQAYFRASAADFSAPFLAEIVRSGAAIWQDNLLVPTTNYNAPSVDWYPQWKMPRDW